MKRGILGWAVVLCFLGVLVGTAAAMENMEPAGSQNGGMDMGGTMIMLDNDVQDGIMAMAHLKDIKAAMAKMGMDKTHHFMVMFKEMSTGKQLTDGLVAVKITDPSGKKHEAIKLMAMDGSFGSDVVMDQKGPYVMEVGVKFNNGDKRQFSFHYDNP